VYQGFSLLTANAREIARPALAQIAARHGTTKAQVVFRFAQQSGMLPLTGTSSPEHMKEDLASSAFELTAEELRTVARIAF
jgi:diketogulonate reductase-like aldo/keto reductase